MIDFLVFTVLIANIFLFSKAFILETREKAFNKAMTDLKERNDNIFQVPDQEIQGEFKSFYDYLDSLENKPKRVNSLNTPAVISANKICEEMKIRQRIDWINNVLERNGLGTVHYATSWPNTLAACEAALDSYEILEQQKRFYVFMKSQQ
jgi:hypothetical protein